MRKQIGVSINEIVVKMDNLKSATASARQKQQIMKRNSKSNRVITASMMNPKHEKICKCHQGLQRINERDGRIEVVTADENKIANNYFNDKESNKHMIVMMTDLQRVITMEEQTS